MTQTTYQIEVDDREKGLLIRALEYYEAIAGRWQVSDDGEQSRLARVQPVTDLLERLR
jgi:hypothetical protein